MFIVGLLQRGSVTVCIIVLPSAVWQFELHCDKTNKVACAPSEDSDQPGHLPSLISVFAVHSVGS